MNQDINDESLKEALAYLSQTDPDLEKILKMKKNQIIRFKRPSGFIGLINLVVEQQLSVASAKAIFERLKRAIVPFTPKNFLLIENKVFKSVGLSQQKINYCQGIAKACFAKELDFLALKKMSNYQVEEKLMELKGVGPWTAQCYLLGCMGRIDAWPSSDLGLQVAIQRLKNLKKRPQRLTIDEIAEPWKPYRSVAALILWSSYD